MQPTVIPIMCGTVRRKPKLTPEASSIVLFGPGVIDITSANVIAAKNAAYGKAGFIA